MKKRNSKTSTNNWKRIMSILMVCFMVFALLPADIGFAGSGDTMLIKASENARPNAEGIAAVTLSIPQNPEVNVFGFTVRFDENLLELVTDNGDIRITDGDLGFSLDFAQTLTENSFALSYSRPDGTFRDGTLATIYFRVRDNAAPGLTTINLTPIGAGNGGLPVTLVTIDGSVLIPVIVTFDPNSGTFEGDNQSPTTRKGSQEYLRDGQGGLILDEDGNRILVGYRVAFDEDGKLLNPEFPPPTRIGYTFGGWFDTLENANGTTDTGRRLPNDTMPIENHTLYARWIPYPHVRYRVDEEGEAPATFSPDPISSLNHTAQPGTTVTVAAIPTTTDSTTNVAGTQVTWTFSGWTPPADVTVTAGEFTMPNTDVVFTGTWTFTPSTSGDTGNDGGGTTVTEDDDEYEFEDPGVPSYPFFGDHIWFVRGFPDGEFKPENSITRAEIAMILWRLLDSDAKNSPQTGRFSDIQPASWYAQAVNYLASRNIVAGYEDGTFRPNNPITRAELTAVMSRFFELDDNGVADFNDILSDHWAYAYINNFYNRGWGNGFPDGTFRPDSATTRAEAVTMINRVLGRVPNPVTIDYQLENHLYDLIGVTRLFTDITNTHWAFYQIMEAAIEHEFHIEENLEVWETISIIWFSNPRNIAS